MGETTGQIGVLTNTLLDLRDCVRPSPTRLADAMDIPRTTAQNRIKLLEQEGLVTGYVPTVRHHIFGEPFLIEIDIDARQYQFQEDLKAAISSLRDYMRQCIGHALLTFYVYEQNEVLHAHAVVVTRDVDRVLDKIYLEQNIARETMKITPLVDAHGIPEYGSFSLTGSQDEDGGVL